VGGRVPCLLSRISSSPVDVWRTLVSLPRGLEKRSLVGLSSWWITFSGSSKWRGFFMSYWFRERNRKSLGPGLLPDREAAPDDAGHSGGPGAGDQRPGRAQSHPGGAPPNGRDPGGDRPAGSPDQRGPGLPAVGGQDTGGAGAGSHRVNARATACNFAHVRAERRCRPIGTVIVPGSP